MSRRIPLFHLVVAAIAVLGPVRPSLALPVDPVWFDALAQPDGDAWIEAEAEILNAWSDTGSEALNMIQTRGENALDEGDFPSAIGHLSALIDHAPDHAMGYQLRGMAFWLNGDFGLAGADLARALELEPKQYLALTQLGMMLEELDSTEAAGDALRMSLTINPHQQDAIDAASRLDAVDNGTDI
ncbi:tetratricopeptide repeat protein [Paracoccus sp. SCSIO 75233]|uniref:tetratricopeptide repeat protein n=1 Tax=Paracoccus sp. SCSIO 75233 TaxID=3017782 RepID=UPI0022F0FB78|nr:tetratricopeptide repeat protein [Paracoccus sp. SCSIO 75233]WBU52498.1 hypothetical protein PAF12_11805 [Paracoccus sp. SCSIO 75233]